MGQSTRFLKRHRRKLLLIGSVWFLAILYFGPVDRWSVCGRCGMQRSVSQLTVFPLPWVLRTDSRIQETPFSSYVESTNLRPNCSHPWILATSCRGSALSRGPGRDLIGIVLSQRSTNLLATVNRFLGPSACDRWITQAMDPARARQFEKLAYMAPEHGFSSAEEFDLWLKISTSN